MDGIVEFRELLESQRRNASEEQVDWQEVRDHWIESIRELMSQIQEWLQPFKDDDLLHVEEEEIKLEEDDLGPYSTKGLRIRSPSRREAHIHASARLVLGAKGRIVIESGSRTATLLFVDGGWVWAYRVGGELTTKPFDKESFLSVLGDMLQ